MPQADTSADSASGGHEVTHGVARTAHRLRQTTLLRDEDIRINLIALVIGVVAGLGAVVFRGTIWVFQELFYGAALNPGNVEFTLVSVPNLFALLERLGPLRYLVVPAVGGLLVGLLIHVTTPEVKGHGVPKVLESILTRGGRIDPKIALYKTLASSIAIASGGSLGREGPIIQIGSAAGSFFGRYLDPKHTRTLVAAGAAAGIAGTFNAPIAGIIFALEILLSEYYLKHVIAVVLSAVMATAVARPILEFTPNPGVREFLVPISYHMVTPVVEFPLYILLGIVVGVVGVGVVRFLYGVEHFFAELDAPEYIKPALGGLFLGASALVTALVYHADPLTSAQWLFGVGYDTIQSSISGQLGLALLVGLGLMKILGFSLSVGSGSSGGVFSPALYIGAMAGGAFGVVVHSVLPTAGAGAYALVGMAGVFAASAGAPLTATIIIFELTGQYTIILPLLIVCVIGSVTSHRMLYGGTIYTQRLRDLGLTIQERRIGSLEDLTAKDVMTTSVDTVRADTTIPDALDIFQQSQHHGLPVVDDDNRVTGIVVLSDLQQVVRNHFRASLQDQHLDADDDEELTVSDIIGNTVITARPDTNLLSIVDYMESNDIGRIPIVDDEGKLCGIITRSDVLDAYDDLPIEFPRK